LREGDVGSRLTVRHRAELCAARLLRRAPARSRGIVAQELILLAVREFVVLVCVLAFVIWLAVRFVRESRR
jgi:hypothetical protein